MPRDRRAFFNRHIRWAMGTTVLLVADGDSVAATLGVEE